MGFGTSGHSDQCLPLEYADMLLVGQVEKLRHVFHVGLDDALTVLFLKEEC